MTGLLDTALRHVEALSPAEQDAIAAQIAEALDDDAQGGAAFANGRTICNYWTKKCPMNIAEARLVRSTKISTATHSQSYGENLASTDSPVSFA